LWGNIFRLDARSSERILAPFKIILRLVESAGVVSSGATPFLLSVHATQAAFAVASDLGLLVCEPSATFEETKGLVIAFVGLTPCSQRSRKLTLHGCRLDAAFADLRGAKLSSSPTESPICESHLTASKLDDEEK